MSASGASTGHSDRMQAPIGGWAAPATAAQATSADVPALAGTSAKAAIADAEMTAPARSTIA
jgi:hypothetical protein